MEEPLLLQILLGLNLLLFRYLFYIFDHLGHLWSQVNCRSVHQTDQGIHKCLKVDILIVKCKGFPYLDDTYTIPFIKSDNLRSITMGKGIFWGKQNSIYKTQCSCRVVGGLIDIGRCRSVFILTYCIYLISCVGIVQAWRSCWWSCLWETCCGDHWGRRSWHPYWSCS